MVGLGWALPEAMVACKASGGSDRQGILAWCGANRTATDKELCGVLRTLSQLRLADAKSQFPDAVQIVKW